MSDERRFEALNEAVAQMLVKQREMENRLLRLEGVTAPIANVPEAASETYADSLAVSPSSAEPLVVVPAAMEPEQTTRLQSPAIETKVGLTVANRVGVVTLILGVAFFFKWAVDNDWIGPAGRVVLGLLAGLAAVGIADYLSRKAQQIFAQGVTGAGLAMLYLSVYAAVEFYRLIPLPVAFAFLAGTTALGYALALRYNSAAIAALGFLGGYATPLLLNSGEDHPWFLLTYILCLDIAAMRLVKQKQWRLLELLAFITTALLYQSWLNDAHRGTAGATAGALAYYTLFLYSGSKLTVLASQALTSVAILEVWSDHPSPFFALELLIAAAGIAYSRRRSTPSALGFAFGSFSLASGLFLLTAVHGGVGAEFGGLTAGFLLFLLFRGSTRLIWDDDESAPAQSLTILGSNGTLYFGLAYYLLRADYHDWLGPLALLVAGLYLAVAVFLRRGSPTLENLKARQLSLALGMAVTFLVLAISIQLSGYRITLGWAIEGAALTWIAARLRSQRAVIAGAAIFVLVAIRLVLFDSILLWSAAHPVTSFANARFLTFTLSAAAAFAAARWIAAVHRRLAASEYLGAHVTLLAGLTLEVLLSVQMTAAPESMLSIETVSVSILFAVYALALVGVGVATRSRVNRLAGLVLIGFVIAKLYLFDVWQLDRFYRITAFVALGLLLISTSFLYSRFRPLIDSLLRRE